MLTLLNRAKNFSTQTAIVTPTHSYTYASLLKEFRGLAQILLDGEVDLCDQRIAFVTKDGFEYAKTQWAIWQAGGVAVPLHPGAPLSSLEYVLEDSQCSMLVVADEAVSDFESYCQESTIRLIPANSIVESTNELPDISPDRPAMILYTSGTTGKPKGVVTTHANIEAQITALVTAWNWSSNDHILNVLPMHHVHGIINIMSCALWSGATCQFLPKFSPKEFFEIVGQGKINLFMAVPTIYHKLISYWDELEAEEKQSISTTLSKMRLMISGSAALPVSVMGKWEKISGHTLLERYGMTEMAMAISNPYEGNRKPGHIGQPLPGVQVRLVDKDNNEVASGTQGEIQVKGANVFIHYWNKPEATKSTFTDDGWFKTGDVAVFDSDSYKILGRESIDIIKSGGYKLSALEIEEVLRTHELIQDCAVVGIPDEEWGEIVAAGLVADSVLDFEELNTWLRDQLSGYKIPRLYKILDDLPRNAMGKVTKNVLKEIFTT